ncbi:MAG: ClbS/DfsB family four-helix bundle protein [Candidatus Dormiibacterota bacterium]
MDRIESSWSELVDAVDGLGPGGLSLTGSDGWAVKDHLAHVAAWEHSLLALIEGRDRLAAMGVREPSEDTDEINSGIWKLHQAETPEQAMKYFRDAHALVVAALGRLSDADLQLPYSHYQAGDPDENQPVAHWVAGDTYEHYPKHTEWIQALRP